MKPYKISSITQFHQTFQLPKPQHPLISVVDYAVLVAAKKQSEITITVADYYSISIKRGLSEKMRYGQQEYDFDEGIMYFLAPTGLILPSLMMTNVSIKAWWRFIYPLLIILFVICSACLIIGIYVK